LLAQDVDGAAVGIGMRLAARRVLGGDDGPEALAQAGAAQHDLDVVQRRARGDGERDLGAEPPDARGRAFVDHRLAGDHVGEQRQLVRDQAGDAAIVEALAVIGEGGAEGAGVVVAEVLLVVVAPAEGHALARQHAPEALEVQRLAVGDHAIEVEHDRGEEHRGNRGKATRRDYRFNRSPDRIGIDKRFSRGG
jgi:hypothetical protein